MNVRAFTLIFTLFYTVIVFLVVPPGDLLSWICTIVGVAGCAVFAQAYAELATAMMEMQKLYMAASKAGEGENGNV